MFYTRYGTEDNTGGKGQIFRDDFFRIVSFRGQYSRRSREPMINEKTTTYIDVALRMPVCVCVRNGACLWRDGFPPPLRIFLALQTTSVTMYFYTWFCKLI